LIEQSDEKNEFTWKMYKGGVAQYVVGLQHENPSENIPYDQINSIEEFSEKIIRFDDGSKVRNVSKEPGIAFTAAYGKTTKVTGIIVFK
jgi:hypothetical protein